VKRMEERGVRYHPEASSSLRKFYLSYMSEWKKKAEMDGGKGLNFNSPQQLRKLFIDERGYSPKDVTPAGNGKMDGEFLQIIANKGDKLARAILEYKGASHMLRDFLDQYDRKKVEEKPGVWVLHPNYRQVGPRTGRFACGDPNLMQVAATDGGRKRADIVLRPRETMGPREGYVWYMPDYSQIEVWLFAYSAGEEKMIEALRSGRDFHGTIAWNVWHEAPDYETEKKHYRKRGKLLMFCKVYGGGAKAVADLLGCTVEEAQKFISDYERGLPGVRPFIKRMSVRAERDGYIYNTFGRKFEIDPKYSYKSVNYLIQGTAADILKEAMINVGELLDRRWPGAQMLLTIHDELAIEVPLKYHSKKLMREIVKAMQGDFHKYINCPTPLPVSMKYATERWSSAKEVKL
jgi:DNA polymerase I